MIFKSIGENEGSPPSRKIHLIVAQVICMSITTIVVGLRIYERAAIHAVGTDDYLILLALVNYLLIPSLVDKVG